MSDYQTIIDDVATILTEKTKINRENLKPELHLEESGLDSFARIELVWLSRNISDSSCLTARLQIWQQLMIW